MCIIIKPVALVSLLFQNNKCIGKNNSGFTLVEVLVSLAIVMLVMYGVFQWGIVMQKTSDVMAKEQEAIYLVQQVCAGHTPNMPNGWNLDVVSIPTEGLLYETTVSVSTGNRCWNFYFAGTEALSNVPSR